MDNEIKKTSFIKKKLQVECNSKRYNSNNGTKIIQINKIMKLQLSPTQEDELKDQAKKEILDKIKKQKTLGYFIVKVMLNLIGLLTLIAFFYLMVQIKSSENFESCWIKDEVAGYDEETGQEATKDFHIDCSRFIAN